MSPQSLPPRANALSLSNLTDDVYGYIYRTTHEPSSSSYVGQHIYRKGEGWRRYLGSGIRLTRAVEKHGADAFTKELLAVAPNIEELNMLEIEHISLERLHGGAQYNIADGGNSFPLPDQAERVALLWQDGDYRAIQRESRVSFWSDGEIRAKQSSMVKDLWANYPGYRERRIAAISQADYRERVSIATSLTKQSDRVGYSLRYTKSSHGKSHAPEDRRQSCPFCVEAGWAAPLSLAQIKAALEGATARTIGISAKDRGRIRDLAGRFDLSPMELFDYMQTDSSEPNS